MRRRWAWPLSVALHLVPLYAVSIHLDPSPDRPPPPTIVVRYHPSPVPDLNREHGADILVAAVPPAVRHIEVRRRRTFHVPRREPAASPAPLPPEPGPALTLPDLTVVDPVASAPLAPIVEALTHAAEARPERVATSFGEVQLRFLLPGEPPADALTLLSPPVVLIAATDDPPAGDGWQTLPASHALFRQPHDVTAWWATCLSPPPQVLRRDGDLVALWLPLAVRAGWEARHPQALALVENVGRVMGQIDPGT